MSTSAQEHFIKALSGNTVRLQMITFVFSFKFLTTFVWSRTGERFLSHILVVVVHSGKALSLRFLSLVRLLCIYCTLAFDLWQDV